MNPRLELRVWLERICTLPTDSVDERRRKVTLFILAGICVLASIVWGILYYAILGPRLVVPLTFGFTVVVGAALILFLFLRRFELLLYPFFLMILWNPIAMQWSLGGFAASGVLMTWSVLAPFCALMFQDIRRAILWFAAFLFLLAVSLLLDDQVQAWAVPVSQTTSMVFFAMNLIGPSIAIFLSMMYFVNAFQKAHQRSEALLLNILPAPIADRLKEREQTIADAFPEVTILFADIVDFTPLSARVSPRDLVQLLNRVFSAFDRLTERYGLEKIKTIGDAYMVAGGLPEPRADHAEAVAEMALDMQAEIRRLGSEIGETLALRVGIDTGPVVAGVIGERKFAYDLWGDSVNTASRMESHGLPDQIQLSERAYARLKKKYVCRERGMVQVKGKGEMRVYTLVGRRSDALPGHDLQANPDNISS